MRQLVIISCILLLIVACSSKNKVPKGILAKQEMEDVLWDLLRGDQMLDGYTFPRDSLANKSAIAQGWYDEIFRLHKTDRTSFQKSYTWYKKHPEVMKELMDSISAKQINYTKPPGQATVDSAVLNRESRAKMDSALRAAAAEADSLKKPIIRT